MAPRPARATLSASLSACRVSKKTEEERKEVEEVGESVFRCWSLYEDEQQEWFSVL